MKSKNLDLAERSLGGESDSWHEYNLDVAVEAFRELSDDDWTVLEKTVMDRPEYWQERCAEVAGDLGDSRGVRVLMALLNSGSDVVAAISASQLSDLNISLPQSSRPVLADLHWRLQRSGSNRADDVRKLIDTLGN